MTAGGFSLFVLLSLVLPVPVLAWWGPLWNCGVIGLLQVVNVPWISLLRSHEYLQKRVSKARAHFPAPKHILWHGQGSLH